MASVHSTSKEAIAGPAWQIAELFPNQGDLSEGEYLFLTDHSRRVVEFAEGRIEVLPMPTLEHQEIVLFLVNLLRSFIAANNLGRAIMAPLRLKLGEGKFREPDILFVLQSNISKVGNRFWQGADLVMEVVSEDDPARDLQIKRMEYAEAGIAEYWIVDPRNKTINVLKLEDGNYITFAEAREDGVIQSSLLPGFTADTKAVFAAANPA
jgi:Uma2 family endonuclease